MITRILSLIRRRRAPLPRRRVTDQSRARLNVAVRRQEQYNFLHYCGDVQPEVLPYDAPSP